MLQNNIYGLYCNTYFDQMKILHHEIIHVVWCNFMLTLNYILQIHYFEFKMVNVANIEKWMGGS